jgi:hypothetical protein
MGCICCTAAPRSGSEPAVELGVNGLEPDSELKLPVSAVGAMTDRGVGSEAGFSVICTVHDWDGSVSDEDEGEMREGRCEPRPDIVQMMRVEGSLAPYPAN